jgi:hypothetical protein
MLSGLRIGEFDELTRTRRRKVQELQSDRVRLPSAFMNCNNFFE